MVPVSGGPDNSTFGTFRVVVTSPTVVADPWQVYVEKVGAPGAGNTAGVSQIGLSFLPVGDPGGQAFQADRGASSGFTQASGGPQHAWAVQNGVGDYQGENQVRFDADVPYRSGGFLSYVDFGNPFTGFLALPPGAQVGFVRIVLHGGSNNNLAGPLGLDDYGGYCVSGETGVLPLAGEPQALAPEPGALALLLPGLAPLGLLMRRKLRLRPNSAA